MSAEARLKQLGIVLPAVPSPVANYLPYRIAGNLLFLAGQGPRDDKGNYAVRQGRVPRSRWTKATSARAASACS